MKQDSFEKYVNDNRGKFDVIENFDQELSWEQIEVKKADAKSSKYLPIIGLGMIFLCLIAFSMFSKQENSVDFGPIALLDGQEQKLTTELYKKVQYKEAEVLNKKIASPEIDELFEELNSMTAIEELLKENFKEVGTNDKLASTLIQYYESKSRLLELILFEIAKKEKNEKVEQTIF